MAYGYVYYSKNEINGKMYIGKVTAQTLSSRPNYRGSGIDLKEALEEYGSKNFSIHFLAEANSSEELTQLEKYYLIYYKIPNENFYNINLATSNSEQSNYFNKNNKKGTNLRDIICYNIKTKETYVFNNLIQFCREHGFSRGCIFNVMSGQRVTHKDCVFWYSDYPISSDALNWIINYKLKTTYKTKYIKIAEVKEELSNCYKKAQNKLEKFEFHGYYIEDNKEIKIDWKELEKFQSLIYRDGESPKPEKVIDTVELNTEDDKKFEDITRPHEYVLVSKDHTLYFSYNEINNLTKIYTDLSARLVRQAINRKQKTVMNRKYQLIILD